jgi:RNA polymerase sigma factor (TIGR02999 family)
MRSLRVNDPDSPRPPAGADTLFDLAYQDLHRLARARLRASGRHTVLDTTALVHESYLRLMRAGDLRFPDRARFLVYAGQVMRSIIVDLVREGRRQRHGGDLVRVTMTDNLAAGGPGEAGEAEILAVHEALDRLAQVDPRMAKVVEMRYFGGMTDVEIGEALGVTDRTVRRDWEEARLFLAQALR